jgi:hypothetical protein
MNINLNLVESILQIFAALPEEKPVEVAEEDVGTMRFVLEYSCLPGEGEPASVIIPGYPQDMVDATILALEDIELLETVQIKSPQSGTIWHKPGGLTPLGWELYRELREPQSREKILAAFQSAGDIPYQQLIPVWYKGHHAALRQMRINKQAWIAALLLLVFFLMILSRLLR